MTRTFIAIARDPRIVPGIHHYCDEWCTTCAQTRRCLAFRCMEAYRKSKGRSALEPPFQSTEETVAFTRALAAVEGIGTIGCAKLTLVAVQRSRKALQQLRTEATAATADPLLGCLDTIERGVDERFPTARAFVRVGLDVPAG